MRAAPLALLGLSALCRALPAGEPTKDAPAKRQIIIPGGVESGFESGSTDSTDPVIWGPGLGDAGDIDIEKLLEMLKNGSISRRAAEAEADIPTYQDVVESMKREVSKRDDIKITIDFEDLKHVIMILLEPYRVGALKPSKPGPAIEVAVGIAVSELKKMGIPQPDMDEIEIMIFDAWTEFGISDKKAKRQSFILGECSYSDNLTLRTTLAFLQTLYGSADRAPSNVANLMKAIEVALEFCDYAAPSTGTISPDPTVPGGTITPNPTVPGGTIVPGVTIPGGSLVPERPVQGGEMVPERR